MIEKALKGNRSYWAWIAFLIACIGLGLNAWAYQLEHGLGVTGMGRDISWGLYIAQFTFLVGVAASAVMVVLPYYLHNRKEFGKIVIVGEFLAVSAAVMCMLFILADLGKPQRVLNVLRYPTPNSMVFWDVVVLNGYLLLNLIGGWTVLGAERKGIAPPKWVKPLIYLSIPWAFSIHTVTAFLYAGMPGRHLWLTAVLAPRFLASAFAAGTAILILISFILKTTSGFDAGTEVRDSRLCRNCQFFPAGHGVFHRFLQQCACSYAQPAVSLLRSSRPGPVRSLDVVVACCRSWGCGGVACPFTEIPYFLADCRLFGARGFDMDRQGGRPDYRGLQSHTVRTYCPLCTYGDGDFGGAWNMGHRPSAADHAAQGGSSGKDRFLSRAV